MKENPYVTWTDDALDDEVEEINRLLNQDINELKECLRLALLEKSRRATSKEQQSSSGRSTSEGDGITP